LLCDERRRLSASAIDYADGSLITYRHDGEGHTPVLNSPVMR
jgi:hypothetical protein